MTHEHRVELAKHCEQAGESGDSDAGVSELLLAAAAELRKTCATCQYWDEGDEITFPHCRKGFDVLFDGSGFCHRWDKDSQ